MLDELRKNRIEKIEALRNQNINPYPHRYLPIDSVEDILTDWQENKTVKIAGRMMAKREHGKTAFVDVKDHSGKIQVYFKKDIIGDDNFKLFTDYIDIGDIIGVEGETFKTRTGEPTIVAKKLKLLSKSLFPLPEKWHGLKDTELRYRKRYLDLIMNDEVKKVFLIRSKVINLIRNFLDQKGFIEVETPMLHKVPGGAAGKPFKTYLEVYDLELYLRIAPELYLKRLLVGGFEKVYEINRSFRNEGISTRHNPEFTMLELYWAYADYKDMMNLCEELICFVLENIKGHLEIEYQGEILNFKTPWKRISFSEILGEKDLTVEKLKDILEKKLDKKLDKLSRSQVLKLCEEYIETQIGYNPVFVIDHLKALSPLAKGSRDNPNFVERFELFISGIEIANAYSELNDPIEQRKRFEEKIKIEEESKLIDYDFLEALEYGMPPAGGLGIGIDRLVMLVTNSASIREVLLFPLLKPEANQ